jgi:hypothetical protein
MYQLLKVALLVLLRQLITHFLDKDVSRLKKEYPGLIEPSSKEEYTVPQEPIDLEELVQDIPVESAPSTTSIEQETCITCQ